MGIPTLKVLGAEAIDMCTQERQVYATLSPKFIVISHNNCVPQGCRKNSIEIVQASCSASICLMLDPHSKSRSAQNRL